MLFPLGGGPFDYGGIGDIATEGLKLAQIAPNQTFEQFAANGR
jgi:hypothetical protein